MIKYLLIFVFGLVFLLNANGQNTVGVLFQEEELIQEGYNLLMPNGQSSTFLIDNCGRIINEWESNEIARTGADLYLLEDGSLLRAKADTTIVSTPSIGAGGVGGVVEILSWDNEILWQQIIQDSVSRQHHDVHMMPNGNVLAIVWDRKFSDEIILNGLDSIHWSKDELWPDMILEFDTSTSDIVWKWNAWDHLVQDFDPEKLNFGVVSEHPELIDINYQSYTFGRKDWMHSNAIDYNPELDQILMSVRNFNEVWIIDHSTTIEEAAGHSGGDSGRGGDILWRWGNPEAYDRGDLSDRKLFYNHDCGWIDEAYHSESIYDNMISIYNNFIDNSYSLGVIVDPMLSADGVNYQLDHTTNQYLPLSEFRAVSHPDTSKQYSAAGSNFQILPNGNFLLHAARQGRTIELTDNQEAVYEYLVPFRNGFRIDQGEELSLSDNFTFSLRRYPSSYSAFENRDLSPGEYLELNPSNEFCGSVNAESETPDDFEILPNPFNNYLEVDLSFAANVTIVSIFGNTVVSKDLSQGVHTVNTDHLLSGIYLIKVMKSSDLSLYSVQKMVKK